MKEQFLKDYMKLKEQFKIEVQRNPHREHELTLLYSPVLNYHAVTYVEQVISDKEVERILSLK